MSITPLWRLFDEKGAVLTEIEPDRGVYVVNDTRFGQPPVHHEGILHVLGVFMRELLGCLGVCEVSFGGGSVEFVRAPPWRGRFCDLGGGELGV